MPIGRLEHPGISGWIDGAVLEFMVMCREVIHGSTSLHGKETSPDLVVLGRPAGSVPSGFYPQTQSFGLYSACVYAYVRAREVLNRSQPAILMRRFHDHTMKLFEKHGMQNIVYWVPDQEPESQQRLVYLLAHKSQDAAKASFAGFRTDPDWLAAKKASEETAGGSLTVKENGVVSEFLVPAEYSPLR